MATKKAAVKKPTITEQKAKIKALWPIAKPSFEAAAAIAGLSKNKVGLKNTLTDIVTAMDAVYG